MSQKTEKIRSIRRDIKLTEVPHALLSPEDIRTGTGAGALKQAILDNLYYVQGRIPKLATLNDWYMAVAYTVRDRMLDRFTYSMRRLADKAGQRGEL